MQFSELASPHEAGVNDIAFDYYGKRLASCSSDKVIKVYDFNEMTKNWDCYDIARAHGGCINRISWAHPEFGQLLASCSDDRMVNIWEEQDSVSTVRNENKERWQRKVQLSDSKKGVKDVKFAPKHLGLKVATASAEGIVRIYEATDVFALNYWTLQDTFHTDTNTSISTNTNANSNENGTSRVDSSEHGLTSLSWNDSSFEPAKIVVGGYAKKAVIYTYDTIVKNNDEISHVWKEELVLEESKTPIHDVAWAPSMGRSYHLIATANRTNTVRIHKIDRIEGGKLELNSTVTLTIPTPVTNVKYTMPDEIWRVTWNSTGTVLITTTEQGIIYIFKKNNMNLKDEWNCMHSIQCNEQPIHSVYSHFN